MICGSFGFWQNLKVPSHGISEPPVESKFQGGPMDYVSPSFPPRCSVESVPRNRVEADVTVTPKFFDS